MFGQIKNLFASSDKKNAGKCPRPLSYVDLSEMVLSLQPQSDTRAHQGVLCWEAILYRNQKVVGYEMIRFSE